MSSLQELESERKEALENIGACAEYLALEPNDEESIELKKTLEQQLRDVEEKIAAEKEKADAANPPPPPPAAPDAGRVEDGAQASFNVKDVVMAKYSADKQWYQATIVTKTGSSTDPVYTVTFKGYGNTETKRKHEIRDMESKKRKYDWNEPQTELAAGLMKPPKPTHTISGAPSVDPSLVQKREPSKVSDGPTREPPKPKKLKGSKALDKVQNNWQAWQKNGPKKPLGGPGPKKPKESQFRTSDKQNINSQYMHPQPKPQNQRSKYSYEATEEDDE